MYVNKQGELKEGFTKDTINRTRHEIDSEIRLYFYLNEFDLDTLKNFAEYIDKNTDIYKSFINTQLKLLVKNPIESVDIQDAIKRNLLDVSRKKAIVYLHKKFKGS